MHNLKELIDRSGLQQKELASLCNVSQPTISDWVLGKKTPSGKNIAKLSEVFNVPTGVILGYDPIPKAALDFSAPVSDNPKETKKDPAENQLDQKLIEMLVNLAPDEVQRVQDFVAGMKATHKA